MKNLKNRYIFALTLSIFFVGCDSADIVQTIAKAEYDRLQNKFDELKEENKDLKIENAQLKEELKKYKEGFKSMYK
jgi:cell division protein FtsB